MRRRALEQQQRHRCRACRASEATGTLSAAEQQQKSLPGFWFRGIGGTYRLLSNTRTWESFEHYANDLGQNRAEDYTLMH
jgi:hypothetical protein